MALRLLKRVVAGAAFVAAAALFWGTAEAVLNRRWPPKGTWWPDDLLASAYNRVVFYAAVFLIIYLAAVGVRALIRRRRGLRQNRNVSWSGPVVTAAVVAANAGWLVVGAAGGYELNLGLFTLDFQDAPWFFGYWVFWATAAAALAVVLRWAARRGRGLRVAGKVATVIGAAGIVAVVGVYHIRQATRPIPRGPNVVLVVVDAWRDDAFNARLMPRLHAYAREHALVFERAWTNGTWTLPAMATMFTGQYRATHQMRNRRGADDISPTLAQILRREGYDTLAFSANRVLNRDSPVTDGFDYFYFSDDRPFLRTVHFYDTNWYSPAVRGLMYTKQPARHNVVLTRLLDDFFSRPRRRPYLLWVHYMAPHAPYQPPPRYYAVADERYAHDFRLADRRRAEVNKRLYDGECRFADDLLAPVLARLRRSEKTIVVITADHGEEFREHGELYYGHGKSVYETLVRIPLIIAAPRMPAGTVTTPVSHVDLAPTLLALAAREPPSTMQGRPFFTAAGPVVDERRPVFIANGFTTLPGNKRERRDALVVWPHKLILFHACLDDAGEFYDLAADPGETRPLPEDEKAQAMRAALKEWNERLASAPEGPEFGGAAAPDLRALGYIR